MQDPRDMISIDQKARPRVITFVVNLIIIHSQFSASHILKSYVPKKIEKTQVT
jgi:hypothetical protein